VNRRSQNAVARGKRSPLTRRQQKPGIRCDVWRVFRNCHRAAPHHRTASPTRAYRRIEWRRKTLGSSQIDSSSLRFAVHARRRSVAPARPTSHHAGRPHANAEHASRVEGSSSARLRSRRTSGVSPFSSDTRSGVRHRPGGVRIRRSPGSAQHDFPRHQVESRRAVAFADRARTRAGPGREHNVTRI